MNKALSPTAATPRPKSQL